MTNNQLFIYLYTMIIQAFIFFYVLGLRRKESKDTKLYLYLVFSLGLIIVLEALSWSVDGISGNLYRNLNWGINTTIYVLNSLPLFFSCSFFDERMISDSKIINFRRKLYTGVWLIFLVLNLINLRLGWIFIINEHNLYERGPGFVANFGVQLMVLVSYFVFSIKYLRSTNGRVMSMLLMLATVPVIGGVIQSAFYGVPAVWSMYGLFTLFLFVFLINEDLRHDALTDLHSRGQFEGRVKFLLKKKRKFTVALIDLDGFKQVNDTYGHLEGDELLRNFANVMQSCVRQTDMASRVGGDEFALIIEESLKDEGFKPIVRLAEAVNKLNQNTDKPYSIAYSIGVHYVDCAQPMTENELLTVIDQRMYANKGSKK